jgi:Mg2+ and Co2+ transporter CorA
VTFFSPSLPLSLTVLAVSKKEVSKKEVSKKEESKKAKKKKEAEDEDGRATTHSNVRRRIRKSKLSTNVTMPELKAERTAEERTSSDDDDNNDDDSDEDHIVSAKPASDASIDFAALIAQAIVHGRRGTRSVTDDDTKLTAPGAGADDSLSTTASDDDGEDVKDLAEAVEHQHLAERRRSKRQKLKQLRFSFAPSAAHDDDETEESSSQAVVELNEYKEFLERTQAAIDKAHGKPDELQILMFGRDSSFKSISIATAVKVGEALCKGARRNDPLPLPSGGDNEIVWLDFTNHTSDDVEQIRRAFGLHPISVDDCVHQRQGLTQDDRNNARLQDRIAPLREKVEFYRRYHLIVTGELDDAAMQSENSNAPMSSTGKRVGDYSVARVTIVTFAHVVLTFRQRRAPSFLPLVHRLLKGQSRGILKRTNWTALTYMDEVMSNMQTLVAEMLDVIDMLNDEVLVTQRDGLDSIMVRLSLSRRGLMALRMTTLAKRDLFESMLKHATFFKDGDEQTINDMVKDIDSIYSRLSLGFEVLNHLDDTFLNRINLEVGVSGEAMNKIMKFFSTVATIFLPLTTIGSIWGMNMKVPGESTDESDLTVFFVIVGVMAGLALLIVLFLWRKGWF